MRRLQHRWYVRSADRAATVIGSEDHCLEGALAEPVRRQARVAEHRPWPVPGLRGGVCWEEADVSHEETTDGGVLDDLSIAVKREFGRVRLLYAWSQAGFPPETIMRLVDRKALSITFLDAPGVQAPRRLDSLYEDAAAERGVPESLVERLHESIGFEPPNPHDRAGEDDLALLDVMELFRSVGVPDEAGVRLFAVYADAVRRVAKAEAELYEANIEAYCERAA